MPFLPPGLCCIYRHILVLSCCHHAPFVSLSATIALLPYAALSIRLRELKKCHCLHTANGTLRPCISLVYGNAMVVCSTMGRTPQFGRYSYTYTLSTCQPQLLQDPALFSEASLHVFKL